MVKVLPTLEVSPSLTAGFTVPSPTVHSSARVIIPSVLPSVVKVREVAERGLRLSFVWRLSCRISCFTEPAVTPLPELAWLCRISTRVISCGVYSSTTASKPSLVTPVVLLSVTVSAPSSEPERRTIGVLSLSRVRRSLSAFASLPLYICSWSLRWGLVLKRSSLLKVIFTCLPAVLGTKVIWPSKFSVILPSLPPSS